MLKLKQQPMGATHPTLQMDGFAIDYTTQVGTALRTISAPLLMILPCRRYPDGHNRLHHGITQGVDQSVDVAPLVDSGIVGALPFSSAVLRRPKRIGTVPVGQIDLIRRRLQLLHNLVDSETGWRLPWRELLKRLQELSHERLGRHEDASTTSARSEHATSNALSAAHTDILRSENLLCPEKSEPLEGSFMACFHSLSIFLLMPCEPPRRLHDASRQLSVRCSRSLRR